MTLPTQRANGSPDPTTPAGALGAAGLDPTPAPGSRLAGVVLTIGAPIAILVSVAIGSALVAGSLWVIRWSWDTIGRVLS